MSTLDTRSDYVEERAELQALLASDLFLRAPSLAQFLEYICRKHFEGEAHLIKEYNIAVEALGRPSDFDQKRDSIVRVEAHRLRKRLRQYYEGASAHHAIRIDVPQGGYAPVFARPGQVAADVPVQDTIPALAAPVSEPPRKGRVPWLLVMGTSALLSILVMVAVRTKGAPQVSIPAAAASSLSEVRINCGSTESFVDREGHTWIADSYYTGGSVGSSASAVVGTPIPKVLQNWRQGSFRYRIPVENGVFELTLLFQEPVFGPDSASGISEGARTFNVLLNGATVLRDFDILTDAGGPRRFGAKVLRDVRGGPDGYIDLEFHAGSGPAILAGLAIVPGSPGRLRPIRMAAREDSYTDSAGRVWGADRYYGSGTLVRRSESVSGTDDSELYRGERYGRLTYTIPVPADGTYTLVLHFAETWFGGAGQGGAGSRLFNIACNDRVLEQDVDVYQQAGGAYKALRKVFRDLKPTPDGKLVIQLTPSRNYAFVNAIEVLDESTGNARPMPAPASTH